MDLPERDRPNKSRRQQVEECRERECTNNHEDIEHIRPAGHRNLFKIRRMYILNEPGASKEPNTIEVGADNHRYGDDSRATDADAPLIPDENPDRDNEIQNEREKKRPPVRAVEDEADGSYIVGASTEPEHDETGKEEVKPED